MTINLFQLWYKPSIFARGIEIQKNVELSDQNNTWNDRFNFASDTIQYETPPQSQFTNKCYQYNKDNSMKGI